ncbi:EF-hand calcium-binding domain-containing protein 2 [Phytophthora cinnamomi]|uniref:EF-hand calcium-binding domain-containing protein 2 n=1 Tax=Phytophthora cinnamomi TaxID=4785 RepID=UPI00355A6141|nr:EF-hand calcium-binding domain-containing protein 2 [Phytophthora cinnamomi]
MFAPPMPVFIQAPTKAGFVVAPCTCGAEDFKLRRKHKRAMATTSEAKQAANYPTDCTAAALDAPRARRSFWRRLLGKGPKCVCPKRNASVTNKPGLVGIPAAYADCDTVTVAGRRVPFTLDMQQRRRASWTPLDAIDEDE